MTAEKTTCPACATEYYAGEPACPNCGRVNPTVAAAGEQARRGVRSRRRLRGLVVLMVTAGVAWLGYQVWRGQPSRALAELRRLATERDSAALLAWCDQDAVSERLPEAARESMAPSTMAPAERRERWRQAVSAAVARRVAAGEVGAWLGLEALEAKRIGVEYHITAAGDPPEEALILRRGSAGEWRIVGLPASWLATVTVAGGGPG